MVWEDQKREARSRGLSEMLRLHTVGVSTVVLLTLVGIGSTTATVMGAPIASPGRIVFQEAATTAPTAISAPTPARHSSTHRVSSAARPQQAVPPSAPAEVNVKIHGHKVTVTWSPPRSEGSSAIESYTITIVPGGIAQTVGASTHSVTFDLHSSGDPHTYMVVATNASGSGAGTSVTLPRPSSQAAKHRP